MKIECPNCSAALIYDAASKMMKCNFCNSSFTVYTVSKQETKETLECDIYSCTSCGAELSVNSVEASTFCAYCGQPTIVYSRVSQEQKPKWIIPFQITKKEAIKLLRDKIEDGAFVPRQFANFEIEKIHGIYIPYWLVDAYYHDVQTIRGTVGSGKYSRTQYFDREAEYEFKRLPFDASCRLNDELSQKLEPFDMDKMKPFEAAYMSGYYADSYDQSIEVTSIFAQNKAKKLFDAQILATVPTTKCSVIGSAPTFKLRKAEYALFPVWFLTIRFQNKPYTMMVNGQTGKTVGAIPFSKVKVSATWIGLFSLFSLLFAPVCALLAPSLLEPEAFEIIGYFYFFFFIVFAVATAKASINWGKIKQMNILTRETKLNQLAHKRQDQEGGRYE